MTTYFTSRPRPAVQLDASQPAGLSSWRASWAGSFRGLVGEGQLNTPGVRSGSRLEARRVLVTRIGEDCSRPVVVVSHVNALRCLPIDAVRVRASALTPTCTWAGAGCLFER